MAYRALRPLRVGGFHYAVGKVIPEGSLLESRAEELLKRGYIIGALESSVETSAREAAQTPETPTQETEQPPEAQPKAKGRKKTETVGGV